MSSHPRRISFLILAITPLVLSACKGQAPARPAVPAPFKVYQGTGDIGEEKGGRVCFVYGKIENCWSAEDGFSDVRAKPIKLPSGGRLLLVSALSMGGSDGTIDLALLDERDQQPVNILPTAEISSANSGQWDHWQIESLSPMPIILTANVIWNDDSSLSNAEARAAAHQYQITVYTYKAKTLKYTQRLDYTTRRKYPSDKDVIELEKPIIIAMLNGTTMK